MSDLVRFRTAGGEDMLVEVDSASPGLENVARGDNGILEAARSLDEMLDGARPTIDAVLDWLRRLAPDEYEVGFGVKLNAEAGVVVAKTSAEGHFTVRLGWRRDEPAAPAG
ncbi:CU044_2847 family protein [Streptomyces chrestomyceticus]|uniref:CU044_2847 family protein n=1 Tax=Streptomyces chrestomyceticus TaxID=68185 RepID=UPI0034062FBE